MKTPVRAWVAAICCLFFLDVTASESEVVFAGPDGIEVLYGEVIHDLKRQRAGIPLEQVKKRAMVELTIEAIYTKKYFAAKALKDLELAANDVEQLTAFAARDALTKLWLSKALAEYSRDVDWRVAAQEKYLANPDAYQTQEQRQSRHILIRYGADRDLKQAVDLAYDLRKRISDGEDFAKLAEAFSEDERSAISGGDLGFSGKSRLIPEFADTIFSMEVGEVSSPFHSQFGIHIVELLAVQPPQQQSFESLEDRLVQQVRKESEAAFRESLVDEVKLKTGSPDATVDRALIEAIQLEFAAGL